MTIAALIEFLCNTIGDMADVINQLSYHLQQTGTMTEGEYQEIEEIRKRISAIGITTEDGNRVGR